MTPVERQGSNGLPRETGNHAFMGSTRRFRFNQPGLHPSPGRRRHTNAPSRTLMIFPPISSDGRVSAADTGRLSRLSRRNISCAAFSEAGELSDDIRRFSEAEGIPVFTSCYDASLLKSRLIGLLREKGGRQIMLHGVLIRLSGQGVLITGDSGIGKTACGLELVNRGGCWIADDAVILEGRGDLLLREGPSQNEKMDCGPGPRNTRCP